MAARRVGQLHGAVPGSLQVGAGQDGPGAGVVLTDSMPPGPAEHVGQVLRFDVGRPAPGPSAVPDRPRTLAPPGAAVRERTVVPKVETGGGLAPRGLIDGKAYDPARVDASVAFGTSEIRTVVNADTDIPHDFHRTWRSSVSWPATERPPGRGRRG
ncbi:hypothetical protein ACIQOW_30860 [Kitasatospora sp. NPDC091335]|uniref:hypothetical protein n=1 Tax=Kitasatospora sp. NPDC091335 TaxID=3364085 RepID=UPI0038258527